MIIHPRSLSPSDLDACFENIITEQLERDESFLFEHGYPTEEEVVAFIEYRRQVLADWKANVIDWIRHGLVDAAAPSSKLH